MSFIVVLTTLAIVLCLLNLLLTYGVMRRLRAHTELFRLLSAPEMALPAGEKVGSFTAVTTRGDEITHYDLAGPVIVGFLSPSCRPCREALPNFVEHVRTSGGDALAVVLADGTDSDDMVQALESAVRVMVEPPQGPISQAFAVRGTPAFILVEGGRVIEAGGPEIMMKLAA
jgi:hypothetical protein